MKHILTLFILAVASTACQHQAPPTVAARQVPVAVATTAPAAAKAVAPPTPAAIADSLTPETIIMLQQHDLAPLWANQTEPVNTHPTMEGFYGSTPYRISFYFKQVKRDARQPNLFHVEGLDCYKKAVTPFIGTITVRAIQPFTKEMFADTPDSTARAFTAVGQFKLDEDPTTKGAGSYYGKALLDFYIDQQGNVGQAGVLMQDNYKNPTKGCGLLFEGYQLSHRNGQRQPVAFANFYGAVVPQALKKLGLGDRSEEINPNLAKLGWNDMWENDEWWADSPKMALSL